MINDPQRLLKVVHSLLQPENMEKWVVLVSRTLVGDGWKQPLPLTPTPPPAASGSGRRPHTPCVWGGGCVGPSVNPEEFVLHLTNAAGKESKPIRPRFTCLSDIFTRLTRSGRMLCRGLWITKSMLKSLKNSNTVIVPSLNFCKENNLTIRIKENLR